MTAMTAIYDCGMQLKNSKRKGRNFPDIHTLFPGALPEVKLGRLIAK